MSTQSVAISPDDPRLHTIETERLPGEYDSPQARRLYQLDLRNKAERTENCAKLGRTGTCPNGHKSRQVSLCGLRGCPDCAYGLADKTFREWQAVLHWIEGLPMLADKRFTYIEAVVPLERSLEAIEALRDDFIVRLHGLHNSYDFCEDARWDAFSTYRDGCLHFRTLLVGYGPSVAEWCTLFPADACVRVHTVPMYRLSHFFKELVEPNLSRDPIERAEVEALFDSVHCIRASGITTDPRDFSVGDSDSTEKYIAEADLEPSQAVKRPCTPRHRCPICKAEVKIFGPWRPIDEVNAEMAGFADHAPPN